MVNSTASEAMRACEPTGERTRNRTILTNHVDQSPDEKILDQKPHPAVVFDPRSFEIGRGWWLTAKRTPTSRSRTVTASGDSVFRDPYIAPIAAATTGSGSGHGTGCIDMTCPFCSQDEGNNSGRSSIIMATVTAGSRTSTGAPLISHQDREGRKSRLCYWPRHQA